jgi:hypothetical protein
MSSSREKPRVTGNRVSAGNPSLSPKKRHALTKRQLDKIYQDSLITEAKANDHAANVPDDGSRPMTDWDAQAGIILKGHQIQRRLHKLNPALICQRSNADATKTGVYHRREDGELQFIVGMESEMNPEFTVTINDEKGEFQKMIPGWRRVLMRLIRAKFITEPRANALFGPPNRDSERWMTLTS